MRELLKDKLRSYIADNNPELIFQFGEEYRFSTYLNDKMEGLEPYLEQLFAEDKPGYIIEELCLKELTRDLRPSKYNYLSELLESEFPDHYEQFLNEGVLSFELINLIEDCTEAFEAFGFSEINEDDRFLRYHIIVIVNDYLN